MFINIFELTKNIRSMKAELRRPIRPIRRPRNLESPSSFPGTLVEPSLRIKTNSKFF